MKKSIFTEKHIKEFKDNGFTIIENFLTLDEVEELHQTTKKLCYSAPNEQKIIFGTPDRTTQESAKYFLESGDKIRYFYESGALDAKGDLTVHPEESLNKIGHALHTVDPFKKVTFSDNVKNVCTALGYKRPAVPQSMYIFKNAKIGGEVVPHQDGGYLYTTPMSTLGFWIAVEDATPLNGCLDFIKGSHKTEIHRRYMKSSDENSTELLIHDKPIKYYPESDYTKAPVKKGSCVLIHANVVHKSDNNKSGKSRHAYTFHIIETHECIYSNSNWLQPSEGKEFSVLYENI